MPPEDLERLRVAVLNGAQEDDDFYPATLTQISTLGIVHNHAPIAEIKTIPSVDGVDGREIRIFRFYIDGLIIHFHRHAGDDGYTKDLGDLIVGSHPVMTVSTVTFNESFQFENLVTVLSESLPQKM